MKRIFSILVLGVMLFTLLPVQASDTEPITDAVTEEFDYAGVNAVMEKIEEIGIINLHSGNRIKQARIAYDELDDSHKELVENFEMLIEAEDAIAVLYEELSNTDHAAVYEATGQYIADLGTPGVGSVGGEWMVICLTRSGGDCPDGYYENVVQFVQEEINEKEQLHRAKSTENSRVILALTSAGYDVANVDGHNLLCGLSDMNYLKKQGVNGPIWALIALDSYDYEIPENVNPATQATREEIIAYILSKQFDDGGWSIFGNVADPDMTGMAIQALAPYYHSNPEVTEAVDRALICLSEIQYENGGFGSIDGICAESCAQVIVALTALGIDPETDERFVKNGVSVVDALCMFAVSGGGFEHVPGTDLNGMATEQGQYALTAYFRFLEGETFLYDMRDVTIFNEEDEEIVDDAEQCEEEISDEEALEPEEEKTEQSETVEATIFTGATFSDVAKSDWYYESVKYVYENHLMQGTENGFDPDAKMTRAMLVTVLYRMIQPKNVDFQHSFLDVPQDAWYADAVCWAAEREMITGISPTQFAPNQELSREQLALLLYRFAKMQGYDVSQQADITMFYDVGKVSSWAMDAMEWAIKGTLIQGTTDATLSPKDTATRAQVATILMRFCEMVANQTKGSEGV